MEYVQVPLSIAMKAMRVFKPLIPIVNKRINELRTQKEAIEEEPKKIKSVKK